MPRPATPSRRRTTGSSTARSGAGGRSWTSSPGARRRRKASFVCCGSSRSASARGDHWRKKPRRGRLPFLAPDREREREGGRERERERERGRTLLEREVHRAALEPRVLVPGDGLAQALALPVVVRAGGVEAVLDPAPGLLREDVGEIDDSPVLLGVDPLQRVRPRARGRDRE